jgi:hypothetical protein
MLDRGTGTIVAVCLAILLVAPSVGAQQVAPEARGFNAPTLEGDWRFRLALNGWIPDSIPINVDARGASRRRVSARIERMSAEEVEHRRRRCEATTGCCGQGSLNARKGSGAE